jgi:hypothetical protein
MKRIAVLLVILLGPTCAFAQDTIPWKKVGPWNILVDRIVGYGCFMVAEYEQGTILRLGIAPKTGDVYILLADAAWKSLEVQKDYDLEIQFDSERPWKAPSRAIKLGSATFLMVKTNDLKAGVNFLEEFARKQGMRVRYQTKQVANLSLRSSAVAIVEMLDCHASMQERRAPSSNSDQDPFSGSSSRKESDPFR